MVDWFYLIPAVVVLLLPPGLFLRSKIRAREFESLLHQRFKPLRDLRRQPLLWIDLVRGYAGAWAIQASWGEDLAGRFVTLLVTFGLLFVALVVQTRTRRVMDATFAPLSFCTGITFALLPVSVATLVLVFALSSLAAFRTWTAFFVCGAAAAGGLGFLMIGRSPLVAVVAVLLIVPSVLAWLDDKPLRLPLNRIRVRREGGPAEPAGEADEV